MSAYIEFKNVKKVYQMGEVEIEALRGVDFTIDKGEFVIIAGASGAGKSTILNILGGMDSCTSGDIFVDGREISKFSNKELTTYRRYDIGFVFQFYNLVQNLTAKENVELATQISKNPLDIDETIAAVGLRERAQNFPAQLSGGEQQRVAIARALAKNPKLLLCDEPTGALDYNTGKQILKLLQDMCKSGGEQQRVAIARALAKNPKLLLCDEPTGALDYNTGKQILKLLQDMCKSHHISVVVITHNLALTAMGDKVIKVRNGAIESIEINENPLPVERIEY